jgi:superfamily II DNA or RNA helicase
MRRPSDLGFDDDGFILPPLIHNEYIVQARTAPTGTLFDLPAIGLQEEREEQRRTLRERCEKAAELVAHDQPAVAWCHLNDEGNLLARLIPDAEQISGSDSIERKEELLTAFSRGELRVLVTKPKIGAWGLNWQHAAHMVFFPSHSYEQYYQGVRRMWRFGQTRPVVVDVVATEGSRGTLANLERKAKQADRMFTALVEHMNEAIRVQRSQYMTPVEVPSWL